MFIGLLV